MDTAHGSETGRHGVQAPLKPPEWLHVHTDLSLQSSAGQQAEPELLCTFWDFLLASNKAVIDSWAIHSSQSLRKMSEEVKQWNHCVTGMFRPSAEQGSACRLSFTVSQKQAIILARGAHFTNRGWLGRCQMGRNFSIAVMEARC